MKSYVYSHGLWHPHQSCAAATAPGCAGAASQKSHVIYCTVSYVYSHTCNDICEYEFSSFPDVRGLLPNPKINLCAVTLGIWCFHTPKAADWPPKHCPSRWWLGCHAALQATLTSFSPNLDHRRQIGSISQPSAINDRGLHDTNTNDSGNERIMTTHTDSTHAKNGWGRFSWTGGPLEGAQSVSGLQRTSGCCSSCCSANPWPWWWLLLLSLLEKQCRNHFVWNLLVF